MILDFTRETGIGWCPSLRTRVGQERGLALVGALMIMMLVGVLAAAAVSGVLSALRTSVSDYQEARVFYAAEAGSEAALAALQAALQDGFVSDEELGDITPPQLEGFDFTGFEVVRAGDVRVETITDGDFAGLYALTQDFEINSPATARAGAHTAITVGVAAQAIPVFQFGVFYEGDLEIHNGPPMHFFGRVHSNSDIYLNSENTYFHEAVTTPERVIRNFKMLDRPESGVYIDDESGSSVLLTFDSRDTPDPEQFKAKSYADFDARLRTGAFGLVPLNLPLPEGVEPHELIRPREPATDTKIERATKLAWLADLYVTVNLDALQSRNGVCGPGGGNRLHPDITIEHASVPDKATKCAIFDWRFEQFFDSREMKPVDVLNVDIGELRDWIDGLDESDPANSIRLIYIKFVMPTGPMSQGPPPGTDPSDDGVYPSVRVRDGETLPGPLTIATEHPLYVWGDYNSQNKKPAALGADALTVLSGDWDDAEHQDAVIGEWNLTHANPTELQASLIVGHSATECDFYDDVGCSPDFEKYGGGFENALRFLEWWGNIEMTYRGSLVSLWEAKLALGEYKNGDPTTDYYKPPNRDWGFDTDLLDPANLPPGTPVMGHVLRTAFREKY